MHNTTLTVEYRRDQPPSLTPKLYYEASVEPGKVNTTTPNTLVVDIPGQRSARFRVRSIHFLGSTRP